ncbi:MAG: hypothetical protein JST26_12210 [Bacteroidetes bacterium]|nr:hypothetical protein [Bacteroidota bacterium]
MKHIITLFIGVASLFICGCHRSSETTGSAGSTPTFTLTVSEDTSFRNLPELMSFVHAVSQGKWIMFSGRTNGFHGFGVNQNFPKRLADSLIYVYDPAIQRLYTMEIPSYGGDTGNVFLCTNLASTQQGGYLYACGGYGVTNDTNVSANKTYSYFMRMQLDNAIEAVMTNNPAKFKKAINWGKSDLVRATGGELYCMPDGRFYMNLGHNFEGTYAGTNSIQRYLDTIKLFNLTVNGFNGVNSLTLLPAGIITDGLPDTTTQFHRRDLVVAPSVLADGSSIGLAIYGGVFTYTPGGIQSAGNPFSHPIYVDYSKNPSYRVDSYNQWTNIYSTAFVSMYDSSSKSMMTSLLGGIGDSQANFSAANWTKVISTNIRSFANNKDTTMLLANPDSLPGYIGAEAVFIPHPGITYYNANYKILNYAALTDGQVIGYIYGGIQSDGPSPNSASKSTHASNKVYKVVIHK